MFAGWRSLFLPWKQVAIVTEFANYVRGVRVVYHFTDYARVTLGQYLTQQVSQGLRVAGQTYPGHLGGVACSSEFPEVAFGVIP